MFAVWHTKVNGFHMLSHPCPSILIPVCHAIQYFKYTIGFTFLLGGLPSVFIDDTGVLVCFFLQPFVDRVTISITSNSTC